MPRLLLGVRGVLGSTGKGRDKGCRQHSCCVVNTGQRPWARVTLPVLWRRTLRP